ncbi:MAG TPA: biotin/lipoyl-containing protein [Candidatus Limnocylindrales bacterium]|nr:biotin/lipoyl-containing protein [Candidatus Limnocylindrales bacterium]
MTDDLTSAGMPAPAPPSVDPGIPSTVDLDPPAVDPADAALFGVIDRLAAILDHSDLVELEVQVGETGLILRKPGALAQVVAVGPGAPGGDPSVQAAGAPLPAGAAADHAPLARPSVKAPLTGIWYGSPAPGSAPYIQVGGEVAVGQVIGLIEAMKLFNEIKSDLAGRVAKVNAENGKLVKAKQPLIEVEPL